MTLQRRSFLAGILAASAAPAIVRASSLMKIITPSQDIILPKAGFVDMPYVWGGSERTQLIDIGNGDFTVELWLYPGRIDEFRITKGPALRDTDDIKRNGIGPQWSGRRKSNFVKPEIAFDLSDRIPANGKWDYVNVGPNGMSLEKW